MPCIETTHARSLVFFSSLNHTRLFVLCIIICHINGRPTHCRSILSYTIETRERPTLQDGSILRAATLATDGSSRWGRCRSRRSRRPWRTWRPCTRRRSAAAPSTAGCRCTPPLLYIHTMHIYITVTITTTILDPLLHNDHYLKTTKGRTYRRTKGQQRRERRR